MTDEVERGLRIRVLGISLADVLHHFLPCNLRSDCIGHIEQSLKITLQIDQISAFVSILLITV